MKDDKASLVNKNHNDIEKTVSDIIESLGPNSELVFQKSRDFLGHSSTLLIFERFFYKINGCISLTIMLSQFDNVCYADVAIAGGCVGICTLSYGTNNEYKKQAVTVLQNLGFILEM